MTINTAITGGGGGLEVQVQDEDEEEKGPVVTGAGVQEDIIITEKDIEDDKMKICSAIITLVLPPPAPPGHWQR